MYTCHFMYIHLCLSIYIRKHTFSQSNSLLVSQAILPHYISCSLQQLAIYLLPPLNIVTYLAIYPPKHIVYITVYMPLSTLGLLLPIWDSLMLLTYLSFDTVCHCFPPQFPIPQMDSGKLYQGIFPQRIPTHSYWIPLSRPHCHIKVSTPDYSSDHILL